MKSIYLLQDFFATYLPEFKICKIYLSSALFFATYVQAMLQCVGDLGATAEPPSAGDREDEEKILVQHFENIDSIFLKCWFNIFQMLAQHF